MMRNDNQERKKIFLNTEMLFEQQVSDDHIARPYSVQDGKDFVIF